MQSESARNETSTLWVACYNRYDNLAHAPRGTPSKHSIVTVSLDETTGKLTQLNSISGLNNAAFIRHHPNRDVIYVATECIDAHGEVLAFSTNRTSGALTPLSSQSAHGASTCYITVSPDNNHALFVNYWDSTLGVMPLTETGALEPACAVQPPPAPVRAAGLADHLANRQSEPHAHAIVLDPVWGKIAFVPDLGTDEIRQYVFNKEAGTLTPVGKVACAPKEGYGAHGPRYIEFDRESDIAYVVNELSSTVSIFAYDRSAAAELSDAVLRGGDASSGSDSGTDVIKMGTLKFLGLASTRVSPPPPNKNTCGRIAVDPSGKFVLVSNRGDDTITSFRIERDSAGCVCGLAQVQVASTRGATPRHFQFSPSGRFVIAANQDTDNLAVLKLDDQTGTLTFTGNSLSCASPNFVAAMPPLESLNKRVVLRAPVPTSKSQDLEM